MEWSFDNERPIYSQIIEQMEQAIVAGSYPLGERLPGVRDLATMAKVNPNTMQRALAELENRGLLVTQRTTGRFITKDTAQVQALQRHLAASATQDYLRKMSTLGCGKKEISDYINDLWEDGV